MKRIKWLGVMAIVLAIGSAFTTVRNSKSVDIYFVDPITGNETLLTPGTQYRCSSDETKVCTYYYTLPGPVKHTNETGVFSYVP